jgi:hypothetical protein
MLALLYFRNICSISRRLRGNTWPSLGRRLVPSNVIQSPTRRNMMMKTPRTKRAQMTIQK